MKLRFGHISAGAVALATATILATAGNATADDPPGGIDWDYTYSATGVKVYVEVHGDIISVCDTAANGHSAWVQVDQAGIHRYTSTVTNGNGSCKTQQASDGGVFDLDEGPAATVNLTFDGDGGLWEHKNFYNNR